MALGTTTNSQALWPQVNIERSYDMSIDTIFSGSVKVDKLLNGFVVTIGVNQGEIFQKYVATSVEEVNQIILAQIVTFKLER